MLHLYNKTQQNDQAANIKQTTGTWTAAPGTLLHNYAEFTDNHQSKTIGIQYEIYENVSHNSGPPYAAQLDSKTHSKMHIISNNGSKGTEIYDDTKTAYNNIMTMRSNGFVGIGISSPLTYLHIQGSHAANTNLSDANDFYMLIGGTEYATNSYRLIGFGYINGTTKCPPAYIGYKSTDQTGETKGDLIFGTRSVTSASAPSERMRITSDGYVGIGTTSPDYPLEILGAHTIPNLNYNAGVLKVGSWSANVGAASITDDPIGLNVHESILVGGYILVTSDNRIKTDISLINDDTALQIVNNIETYEYNYIDPTRRKSMKTIGFMAQEVGEKLPNAINILTDYLPDEMRIITEPIWTEDVGKYYLNIPDLDMSGAFTGKGKFYVSNDPSGNDEICKEVDIKEVPATSMNEFSTTNYVAEFDQSWNNVFFYGKEVSDFHTLDKNQIFALHHSAIQELDRKHEREVAEKNNKIQNLEGEVSNLTGQVSSLTSRLEALEASVLSLQNN